MQKFPKSFPQNPIPATNKRQRTQYFLLILLHNTKNIARSQLENDPGYQLPHPHIGRTYTLLKRYKMMHVDHRLPLQSQKYIVQPQINSYLFLPEYYYQVYQLVQYLPKLGLLQPPSLPYHVLQSVVKVLSIQRCDLVLHTNTFLYIYKPIPESETALIMGTT